MFVLAVEVTGASECDVCPIGMYCISGAAYVCPGGRYGATVGLSSSVRTRAHLNARAALNLSTVHTRTRTRERHFGFRIVCVFERTALDRVPRATFVPQ